MVAQSIQKFHYGINFTAARVELGSDSIALLVVGSYSKAYHALANYSMLGKL